MLSTGQEIEGGFSRAEPLRRDRQQGARAITRITQEWFCCSVLRLLRMDALFIRYNLYLTRLRFPFSSPSSLLSHSPTSFPNGISRKRKYPLSFPFFFSHGELSGSGRREERETPRSKGDQKMPFTALSTSPKELLLGPITTPAPKPSCLWFQC